MPELNIDFLEVERFDMIKDLFFSFLLLICIDFILSKKVLRVSPLKNIFKFSIISNLETFLLGLVP